MFNLYAYISFIKLFRIKLAPFSKALPRTSDVFLKLDHIFLARPRQIFEPYGGKTPYEESPKMEPVIEKLMELLNLILRR